MEVGVDCIGLGVGGLLVAETGEIFAALRGPEARTDKDKWEFPGGGVHRGEHLASALQREFEEEYGLEIFVGQLLQVYEYFEEGQHWVGLDFLCTPITGEATVREPGKCSGVGWFGPLELRQRALTSYSQALLEKYLSNATSPSVESESSVYSSPPDLLIDMGGLSDEERLEKA